MHPSKTYNTATDLYNKFRDSSGRKKYVPPGMEVLETTLIRLSHLNSLGFQAPQGTIEERLASAGSVTIKNHGYEIDVTNVIPDLIKYKGNEHLSRTMVEVSDARKTNSYKIRQIDEEELPHYDSGVARKTW